MDPVRPGLPFRLRASGASVALMDIPNLAAEARSKVADLVQISIRPDVSGSALSTNWTADPVADPFFLFQGMRVWLWETAPIEIRALGQRNVPSSVRWFIFGRLLWISERKWQRCRPGIRCRPPRVLVSPP